MGTKKVADGDCMSSIAEALGFHNYHSIYDHGSNSALKTNRPNPNQLVTNDNVFIPDTKGKIQKEGTDKTTTFVVKKKHPVRLRVVIIDRKDKALSGRDWELTTPVAKKSKLGLDGLIEVEVPATATAGTLKLDVSDLPKVPPPPKAPGKVDPKKVVYPPLIKPAEFTDLKPVAPVAADTKVTWDLKIGSMPSFNEASGVQARLLNLGFRAAMENPAGTKSKAAVKAYQKKYKMGETGTPADIQAQIRDRHDNI
jgi:hypothetical protein